MSSTSDARWSGDYALGSGVGLSRPAEQTPLPTFSTDARGAWTSRALGSGGEVSSPVLSPPLPPRQWVKLYTQTASARARIAAARTITVPAEEAAMMVRDYPRLSLIALARRYGYAPDVVRRTLVQAGVAIRKRGRPCK